MGPELPSLLERDPGPSGNATVMVEVGATHGALVIVVPAWMCGSEIEIRRVGTPWEGVHTAIRRRDLRNSVEFAGVFGSLAVGKYQLRVKTDDSARAATDQVIELAVAPSRITELHWLPDEGIVRIRKTDEPDDAR
ncbi:MAG: hypothetical protein WB565_01405 [Acidimicrobiales bacterium]